MATGRFAPSPTGPLHLGNLRTALLAWLFARSAGSRFVLRVEDLDLVASRAEHRDGQLADLADLGLDWDGPVVRQSTRFERYAAVFDELVAGDLVYPCFCSRRDVADALQAAHGSEPGGVYPGTCRHLTPAERTAREAGGRRPAWRLKADGERVGFVDRVLGPIDLPAQDVVVRRNDGAPAYNLAVVVDDHDEGIEEVVRGDDLVASTPAQILLGRWLGWDAPTHAHVPLVLGPDGERLAKRHIAVTLDDWRRRGRSVDALRTTLARSIGIGVLEGRDATDLIAGFDPAAIPRVPWVLPASLLGG